jgi:hypothetical protein
MNKHSSFLRLGACLFALLISSCGKEPSSNETHSAGAQKPTGDKAQSAPMTLRVKELGRPDQQLIVKAPSAMPVGTDTVPQAAEEKRAQVQTGQSKNTSPSMRQNPQLRSLVREQQMKLMQKSFQIPAQGSNLSLKPPLPTVKPAPGK